MEELNLSVVVLNFQYSFKMEAFGGECREFEMHFSNIGVVVGEAETAAEAWVFGDAGTFQIYFLEKTRILIALDTFCFCSRQLFL